MKAGRRWVRLGVAAVVLCTAGEGSAQDSASAEALFNQGVAAMKAGNYDAGCPAVAESHRLDPRPGTLFTLAECEARWGKVATAVAHYTDFVRMVSRLPQDKRAPYAARKQMAEDSLAKLNPTVPQLTLVMPEAAPAQTVVKRDGQVLGAAALGIALPVDPGEHVVVTQVPGGPEHQMRIVIGLGESKTVQVEIEQGAAPMTSGSASASSGAEPSATRAVPTTAQRRYVSGTWIAGGVGAAGMVVWGVTGLMAMSKKSTVNERCNGSVCSSPTGKEAGDSGRTLAQVATVGLGVGVAGLAVGAALYFAGAPRARAETAKAWEPVVDADGHGTSLGIRGVW